MLAVFCTNGFFCADGYQILLAVPVASKSLHNLFTAIGENLCNAKHSVTLLSTFPSSSSHPLMTHVNVLGSKSVPEDNIFDLQELTAAFEIFTRNVLYIGEIMWTNPEVIKIWKNRNSYDAVLIPSYLNDITLPFVTNYTGLFMLVSTPGVEYFAMSAEGNWLPISVVPAITLPYDENMTFFERCASALTLLFVRVFVANSFFSAEEGLIRKFFPDFEDVESYYDRVVLTLINGHPALDAPLPLLPSQVEIGTINARPAQPLPKDLEQFVNDSGPAGIIYFSIGSIAKSTDIPEAAKAEFLKAFSRLPQRVVWKYEGTDLALPPNVITRSWLPQQDLLGHPKTRVFISHCGNLGTQEAKYHGVPVLAVPVAFDQPRNAARMVRKELALSLDWDTLTADSIVEAVNTLVNDTRYSDRMKGLSRILKDQKESPGERAVWWIEYIIRHKGAPHLRYPGKRLHFLQYVSADVVLFLAALVYIFWRLVKLALRSIWRRLTATKSTKKKKKLQ